MSAADLYAKQASLTKVVTFCYDLDNILGGGIWPGQVTELCESAMRQRRTHACA